MLLPAHGARNKFLCAVLVIEPATKHLLLTQNLRSSVQTQPSKSIKYEPIRTHFLLAPEAGLEPATWGLTVPRSTTELLRNVQNAQGLHVLEFR